jgi:Fungal chitosanase of glycosyl hydrolase group 75
MSIHRLELKPGDTLIITVSKEGPPEPPQDLNALLTIGSVTIFSTEDGSYCSFTSDLDICNDGCGPAHGDPHHQSQTAYYSGGKEGDKYLNADVDKYIVVPPQVRSRLPGVVMGCRGRVTNLKTQVSVVGVVGEIGPDDKTGETAYCLAKLLNPMIEYNCGDSDEVYLYELWPDVPAVVDGFTYKLQPA